MSRVFMVRKHLVAPGFAVSTEIRKGLHSRRCSGRSNLDFENKYLIVFYRLPRFMATGANNFLQFSHLMRIRT